MTDLKPAMLDRLRSAFPGASPDLMLGSIEKAVGTQDPSALSRAVYFLALMAKSKPAFYCGMPCQSDDDGFDFDARERSHL